jgi:hypothetical protein
MQETIRSKVIRWWFNLIPAYRGTGARILYLADDWREVRIRLPLNWRTRNYVGTIFGGSMYAAVDPIYMMMLIRNLGPEYTVWDKAACIQFRKPGKGTLYARFLLSELEISSIRDELTFAHAAERVFHVDLTDETGVSHAFIEKTIYVRKRPAMVTGAGRQP